MTQNVATLLKLSGSGSSQGLDGKSPVLCLYPGGEKSYGSGRANIWHTDSSNLSISS